MLSAICFNLDLSKILSSGNDLMYLKKLSTKVGLHSSHRLTIFNFGPCSACQKISVVQVSVSCRQNRFLWINNYAMNCLVSWITEIHLSPFCQSMAYISCSKFSKALFASKLGEHKQKLYQQTLFSPFTKRPNFRLVQIESFCR